MLKKVFSGILTCLLALSMVACNSESIPPETLPSPTEETTATLPQPQVTDGVLQLRWESGNKLFLLQEQGLSVYLTKDCDMSGIVFYDLEVKNDSDISVWLSAEEVIYNGQFLGSTASVSSHAGKWGECGFTFPTAAALRMVDKIQQLEFIITITDYSTYETLFTLPVRVELHGSASLKAISPYEDQLDITEPFMEFFTTQEQLLLEKNGVKISLLAAGKPKDRDCLTYIYQVENTTDEPRYFLCRGTALNGAYFDEGTTTINLQPGTVYHGFATIDKLYDMQSISSMELYLDVGIGTYSIKIPTELSWCTVTSETAGKATVLSEGEVLLLEEQGLRVTLQKEEDDYFTQEPVWSLVVVNDTDQDLHLNMYDTAVGDNLGEGTAYMGISLENPWVAAHHRTVMKVTGDGEVPVSFRLYATQMLDNGNYDILFVTEGRIELTPT